MATYYFWLTTLLFCFRIIGIGRALEIVVPEFTKLPPEITYVDEKASFPLSLTFICEAEPVGRVEIQFYSSYHGGPLKQLSTSPNEGINVISSGKLLLSDLTREKVQRMVSQQEVFHCKASVGPFTLLSRPFAIREAYIREFSALSGASIKEVRHVSFLKGNVAQINCVVPESEPPAEAIFKINDSTQYLDDVNFSDRFRVVKLAVANTYAMLIKDIKAADHGSYSCVARNPHTMRTVESTFVYNFSVTAPHTDIHPGFVFSPTPTNFVMYEGDNATFSCIVKSAPVAQIKFRKISRISLNDLSSRFTSDKQFNLLTLHGATHEDNGPYECRTLYRRKDGVASFTPLTAPFSISVKKRLKITSGPKDVIIAEGTKSVQFNCRISGDFNSQNSETPMPIPQWYINGAPVTSHNTAGVRLEESRIIVFAPKPTHYGIFQCVASVGGIWTSQHAILSSTDYRILRGADEHNTVDARLGQPVPTTEEPIKPDPGDTSDFENCISKPIVEWPYLNLAVDIKWQVNSQKRHLLPLIENFRFVYKTRSAVGRNRELKNWDSIKEKVVDFIFKNKHYRSSSNAVRRRRRFSEERADSDLSEVNVDKSSSLNNRESDSEVENLQKYNFLFTMQNKDEFKPFKPETYYMFQVQYSIQSQYFLSDWSSPFIFLQLLDTPPPVITSHSAEHHGITWEFETDTVQPTSFMILTRKVDERSRPTNQMKRYSVDDPKARQYYFHDLDQGNVYEIRIFAKAQQKRTDLSSPVYLNALKSIVPARPTKPVRPGTNSDESNRLLFIIIGGFVGALFLVLLGLAVVCCLKQKRSTRRANSAFKDPAKTIHRETLMRSQVQPTTHNNFSLSMLNGGPLSHAASNGTLGRAPNLHMTANPLEAQREMETALMHDLYSSQTPNYQRSNYTSPPEYYGNDTLQKREPPSGLSRHNSNDEFGQADTLYQRGPAGTFRSGYSTTSSTHQFNPYQQQQLLLLQQQQQQQQQQQLQQQLALQQYYEGQGTLTGRGGISRGSQYGSNYRLQQGSQQQLHAGFLNGSHQALHHSGGAADNESVYSYFSQFDTYAQTPSYLVEQGCQTADRNATGGQSRNHHRRKRRRQREPEMAAGASAANHTLSQPPFQRDMATNTIEEEEGLLSLSSQQQQQQMVPGVPPLPSRLHRDSDTTYEPLPEETSFLNIYGNTGGGANSKQPAYHSNGTPPTSSLRSRRSTGSNGASVVGAALSTVKEHTPPPPPGQFATSSLPSVSTAPANGLPPRQLLRPANGGAGVGMFKRGVSPLFSDPPRMRDISDYAIPETRT